MNSATAPTWRFSRPRTCRSSARSSNDYDLRIALKVDSKTLHDMLAKGKAAGVETRGVSDHGFVHSIYFRDPNGYVIELAPQTPGHDSAMDPATNGARAKLERWTSVKQRKEVHANLGLRRP